MSERQVCIIGGGMSQWGRRPPVWWMSSRKQLKLASMTFRNQEKGHRWFFVRFFLLRPKSISSQCRTVMAERIGLKPVSMCSR